MPSDLDRLCTKLKIRAVATYGNSVPISDGDEWRRTAHPWTVRLTFERRTLTVPFFTGAALTSDPTAADVLACLCSDARAGEQTFEEYCSEFGESTDSRKAESTWKSCRKTAPRLRRFLGDSFDAVAGAEH